MQRLLLKAAAAGVVLWSVAAYADVGRVFGSIALAPPLPLVAAMLLLLPNLALQHAKWTLLARIEAPGLRSWDAARSLFIGFALGLVTPARSGELGGRAYGLHGSDLAAIAGLTAIDKLASMLVTLLAGIAGSAFYAWQLGWWSGALTTGVAVANAVLVVVAAVVLVLRSRTPAAPAKRGRLGAAWQRARASVRAIPIRTFVWLLGLSIAFYAVFITQFVLLLHAMGGGDTIALLAGAATVMLLKTVIPPLTFGELGIREGAAVFVFAPLGFRTAAAFDASLLLFGLNVLLPAMIGSVVLFLFSDRRSSLS
jgi:uncharacterized membrane protein YbhN (UPF0104 family)